MGKKPFDQNQGHGTGTGAGQPTKPEPGRKMPAPPEKHRPSKREQPAGMPVDQPMPGTEHEDILDSDRSDRESGRPVQLEEDKRRHADPAARRPDDRKGTQLDDR